MDVDRLVAACASTTALQHARDQLRTLMPPHCVVEVLNEVLHDLPQARVARWKRQEAVVVPTIRCHRDRELVTRERSDGDNVQIHVLATVLVDDGETSRVGKVLIRVLPTLIGTLIGREELLKSVQRRAGQDRGVEHPLVNKARNADGHVVSPQRHVAVRIESMEGVQRAERHSRELGHLVRYKVHLRDQKRK